MSVLYTDINIECCAWLGSRVEDGSLPPGDVLLADVRDLTREHLIGYRHIHLFAGIGGFPLALAWADWPLELSVLTGGFPCPDISVAGKGAGLGTRENPTERSGLFWEIPRVLNELGDDRPAVCICENVGALSSRGLDTVAAALGEAGYVVPDAYRVGAWAFGCPHERERWWVVGWRDDPAQPNANSVRGIVAQASRCDGAGGLAAKSGAQGCTQLHPDRIGLRAIWQRGAGAEPDKPVPQVFADAAGARLGEGCGVDRDQEGARSGRNQSEAGNQSGRAPLQPHTDNGQGRSDEPEPGPQERAAAGWRDPVDGPWRRVRDEWQYAGPPVLVYSAGAGRGQRHAPAEPSEARFTPRRPDPTLERGWPVPVLPGFNQHDWEFPRLHQRGVGDAVHGLPGRLADSLNRCGVMALGNAIVPQVAAAIARGIVIATHNGVHA